MVALLSHPSLSSTQQKPQKEPAEKRVVREGFNSLITHTNASSFSIFSHIRHFVLQTELCETFNSRVGVAAERGRRVTEEEDDEEEEEEGEEEKKEAHKMPVVCGRQLTEEVQFDILSSHPTASER